VTGSNDAGVGESSNVIVITTSQELNGTELNGEFISHMTHMHTCTIATQFKSHL